MKIIPKSENCVVVEFDGWTYCLDNSTNDHIVTRWKSKTLDDPYEAKWEKIEEE